MEKISEICSECRACEQRCPSKSIRMQMDAEGFSYPSINKKTCIDCGLCQKVCPMSNADSLKNPVGDVYAAQSLEEDTLKESTSGGIGKVTKL